MDAECQIVCKYDLTKNHAVVKKFKQKLKNSTRRNRRKKSKFRYHKYLTHRRKTESLCSSISIVNIEDMDCQTTSSAGSLLQDINEWHKQEQLAYWKSRAISLEYENRMLHEHLRNVYAAQTVESHKTHVENNETIESTRNKHDEKAESERVLPPQECEGLKRKEEMKRLYGDKAAKIMGMETAVQLNFELNSTQLRPYYWPNMPLNMKFDH